MKIKDIEISNFRGIRHSLNLSLGSLKSVLIYGDNGSGKSSITDALEWFYYDKVEHLSKEEIGTKGITALRNIFLSDDENAFVDLKFSDQGIQARKSLSYKNSKLSSEYLNSTHEFDDYIISSFKERLILRYKDLLRFILFTKSDRLKEISEIIGFSEVTAIKTVFKKAVYSLEKEIKLGNFDSHINSKQTLIIQQIQQNINNDDQYFNAIRELVEPLKLHIEVKNDKNIEEVLQLINKPEDEKVIRLQLSYEKVIEVLINLKGSIQNIYSSYDEYYKRYQKITKNLDKLKKVSLEKLLSEGLEILEKNIFENEECPLCLQKKSREDLIKELKRRIEELAIFKKEKEEMDEEKGNTQVHLQDILSQLEVVLGEECLLNKENLEKKHEIEQIKNSILNAIEKLGKYTIITIEEIKVPEEFVDIDNSKVQKIISVLKERKEEIVAARKDDLKFSINNKLNSIRQSYLEIRSFKKELEIFKNQLQSMKLIYDKFAKKQQAALSIFLNAISNDINDFYLYMNKSEQVDEIKLIPLDKEDELVGVTIQFKFHGNIVTPPDKYLSESHLNCLGICLFLSSIKAFNKVNNFFILDDVISSFDKTHRLRFANLLIEKFSDYQIFLFTHEKDWFEYIANIVKGRNWFVTEMIWDYNRGVSLEIPLTDLKKKIEAKFKMCETLELGNMIRKYLERLLKEICFNLEVKVIFLYNSQNENRMSNELLSDLVGELKKRKCVIKDALVLNRLSASLFIGNRTSHDSSFNESISDLKVFYDDVLEIEKFFICDECQKQISKRYYDSVKKLIRCKCGNKSYIWQG
ncbi:MAG: AAA family ATPase [Candidatus Humimicrobiaceae bacterium]